MEWKIQKEKRVEREDREVIEPWFDEIVKHFNANHIGQAIDKGFLSKSNFSMRDLNRRSENKVYDGEDIQKKIDKAHFSNQGEHSRMRWTRNWMAKFLSNGFYNYLKLRRWVGWPKDSFSVRPFYAWRLPDCVSLVNPGGRVFVHDGTYPQASKLKLAYPDIDLCGAGRSTEITYSSTLGLNSILRMEEDRLRLAHLTVKGQRHNVGGTGYACIEIGSNVEGASKGYCDIEDVVAKEAPDNGLWMADVHHYLVRAAHFQDCGTNTHNEGDCQDANNGGVELDAWSSTSDRPYNIIFQECVARDNWGPGFSVHNINSNGDPCWGIIFDSCFSHHNITCGAVEHGWGFSLYSWDYVIISNCFTNDNEDAGLDINAHAAPDGVAGPLYVTGIFKDDVPVDVRTALVDEDQTFIHIMEPDPTYTLPYTETSGAQYHKFRRRAEIDRNNVSHLLTIKGDKDEFIKLENRSGVTISLHNKRTPQEFALYNDTSGENIYTINYLNNVMTLQEALIVTQMGNTNVLELESDKPDMILLDNKSGISVTITNKFSPDEIGFYNTTSGLWIQQFDRAGHKYVDSGQKYLFDGGDNIQYDRVNNRYLFSIGDTAIGYVDASGFHDGAP